MRAGRAGQPRVQGRPRRSTTASTTPSLVMVDIWSAGNYGTEEDRTHRLARPLCFLRTDPTDNGYARPIEGLAAGRRSEHDEGDPRRGVRPLAAAAQAGQLRRRPRRAASRSDIKPLEITQPEGPSFTLGGQPGALAELELRHRLQRPRGPDAAPPLLPRQRHERARSSTARSLSEMVVPYGDPRPTAGAQERLRRRRVRHGHVRQQPRTGLRLPWASSSISTATCAPAGASR